jgi:SET and MYND domain-containing protein
MQMKVNAFNAVDTTDLTLGLCFDATLARANHSCVPNAFVSFDGRRATLRTLQPLAAGDEVLISYIGQYSYFLTIS